MVTSSTFSLINVAEERRSIFKPLVSLVQLSVPRVGSQKLLLNSQSCWYTTVIDLTPETRNTSIMVVVLILSYLKIVASV